MQIGMIGLGRMGGNMVRRLMQGGHQCVVYDRGADAVAALAKEGATAAKSLRELVREAPAAARGVGDGAGRRTHREHGPVARRRCSRPATRSSTAATASSRTTSGASKELAKKGIHYVDAGTSGGVWGVERGYCLMVGGPKEAVSRLEPVLRTLAPGQGRHRRHPGPRRHEHRRAGVSPLRPVGRGPLREDGPQRHRVRADAGLRRGVRHLQERALRGSSRRSYRYDLNVADIAELWRRGSVVSSWLLDLTSIALAQRPEARRATPASSQDSGEGRWTIEAAIEEAVPAEVLTAALYARFRSRQEHTFAEKLLSAMRKQFGGHVEPKQDPWSPAHGAEARDGAHPAAQPHRRPLRGGHLRCLG